MARNTELIRQWEILRSVDAARAGISIQKLAAERNVHQRTIRRDLDALCRAGFPLFDERVNGTSLWRLRARPFRGLEETGLSVTEVSALYLGHTMLRAMSGALLLEAAEHAFAKIERALPPRCREFLDQLPRVMKPKVARPKRREDTRVRELLARVMDATLLHRRASMRYASRASGRTATYVVEPHRLVYADGGIYMIAFVPVYSGMRTFAVERIGTFALLDETFKPKPLPVEPFSSSIGVFTGTPEEVVIEFEADAAPYVRERELHPSQAVEDLDDGRILLRLEVCNDPPLRAWILGFGASARVVAPISLARDIFEAASGTRQRYLRTVSRGQVRMIRAS